MTSSTPPASVAPEDDEVLATALAVANVPTLLMVLVQLTGQTHWLDEPYKPTRTKGMADNDSGGLSLELQAEVRSAAFDAIKKWQEGAPVAVPNPSPELMVRMLGVSMGESVPAEYGELLQEELASGLGTPTRHDPVNVPKGFRALIIGAGISGIAAAIRMAEMAIPYLVVERSNEVGGVWLENIYPGAGVDTPSHLYSYSFAPNDWTQYFATREEIHGYLKRVADEHDIRQHIRFQTEVRSVEYDEDARSWAVTMVAADGTEHEERANVLISCVGAFNPPVVPNLPGLKTFSGPAFHTARWPKGLSVGGKKVAIVGNGASAMQVVPAIAGEVDELIVFQRSPQWVQPFEKFMQKVPDPVRLMFTTVPLFRAWYRLRMSWIFHDKLYAALQRDPQWQDVDTAINRINDGHRQYFTDYIKSELAERNDLWPKVIPTYPPFGKRMLQDNGWFRALARPNVELVTDAIDEIRPEGVVTAAGDVYRADILVLATGFDVVHFLSSYEIRGRGGRLLSEVWEGDNGRAYLGMTVPGFPNFFTLYGPNTQTGHGGSLIHTVEAQLDYLERLLRRMLAANLAIVECREDVYEEYSETVDEMHERMIWTHPAMSTYYRNSRGRVVVINPFRNVDFWKMTREPDLGHYRTEPAREGRLATAGSHPGVTPNRLDPVHQEDAL